METITLHNSLSYIQGCLDVYQPIFAKASIERHVSAELLLHIYTYRAGASNQPLVSLPLGFNGILYIGYTRSSLVSELSKYTKNSFDSFFSLVYFIAYLYSIA